MKKIPHIIKAMRLRTLPLSAAGVTLGLLLAYAAGYGYWVVTLLTLLTTISLQILSNICNELGDYQSGTDVDERHGPANSLQRGTLTIADFKKMIRVMAGLSAIFGILLIFSSSPTLISWKPLVLLVTGACAIWAAMHYTLGLHPYGYRGLGDISVFIFFGLVSVLGGYFVAANTLNWWLLLPASAIGFFSVAVLNVNNIRDMETDVNTRVTVPLKIGERAAKIYHTILIAGGWLMLIVYIIACGHSIWNWLTLIMLPLYAQHLKGVWRNSGKELDPMLPLLVISTFVLAVVMGVTMGM